MRVGQLDAELLDRGLTAMLKEPLNKTLGQLGVSSNPYLSICVILLVRFVGPAPRTACFIKPLLLSRTYTKVRQRLERVSSVRRNLDYHIELMISLRLQVVNCPATPSLAPPSYLLPRKTYS